MKKGIAIVAAILVVVGAALFVAALISVRFDWSVLGTTRYETNHYAAEGDFQKIEIDTKSTDVALEPSGNDSCYVICRERSNVRHTVTVEDGTLKITAVDERTWIDRIEFYTARLSMTVYLPQTTYEALVVSASTGDVTVPGTFSFGSMDIQCSTGDITLSASVTGALRVKASTGDIKVSGAHVGSAELTVSTGRVDLSAVTCDGDLSVAVDTGKTAMENVTCQNFISTGDTGAVTLKNVTAAEKLDIERDTGDVRFDNSDAAEITVKTSTGDVTGTLRSAKIFTVRTSTGRVRVPESTTGGICRVTTSTGDVELSVAP